MIFVITPVLLFAFVYYLYVSGYLFNISIEIYSAYKQLDKYVLTPTSNFYAMTKYYAFYYNKFVLVVDTNDFIISRNELYKYNESNKILSRSLVFKPHFIDNEMYFQRIMSNNTIDGITNNVYTRKFHNVEPFIYISITTKNAEYEINKELSKFYLNDNVILDRNFTCWFMKKYKHIFVLPNEEYQITIINNIGEMETVVFEPSNTNKALSINKNSYIIKTI